MVHGPKWSKRRAKNKSTTSTLSAAASIPWYSCITNNIIAHNVIRQIFACCVRLNKICLKKIYVFVKTKSRRNEKYKNFLKVITSPTPKLHPPNQNGFWKLHTLAHSKQQLYQQIPAQSIQYISLTNNTWPRKIKNQKTFHQIRQNISKLLQHLF